MVTIEFGPYILGNRPHGLKQSEADIFTEYLYHTDSYTTVTRTEFFGGGEKKIITEDVANGEYAFQVNLLGGYPPPSGTPENLIKDWEIISSMKADVIIKNGNNYQIVELKQRLDVCVLGQLLTYKFLFEDVLGYPKTTQLVAVGDFIVPGLVQPLLSNNIRIHSKADNWFFPPNYSAIAIRSASLQSPQFIPVGR